MIRLEMPDMAHGGHEISLQGLRIPFGGRYKQGVVLPEVVVQDPIILHTEFPFVLDEVQEAPETLRGHVLSAWGMSVPGDVDVRVYPKAVWVGIPDMQTWSWPMRFFNDHAQRPMRIVAPRYSSVHGNTLWEDGKRVNEFLLTSEPSREVHFDITRYRTQERRDLELLEKLAKEPREHALPNAVTKPA